MTTTTIDNNNNSNNNNQRIIKVVLAVGTYDGGVASYEMDLDVSSSSSSSSSLHNNDKKTTTTKTKNQLQLIFASPIHQGSVRSLMVSATGNPSNSNNNGNNGTKKRKKNDNNKNEEDIDEQQQSMMTSLNSNTTTTTTTTTRKHYPFVLVSVGYDEMMKIHDYKHNTTNIGEVRLPSTMGGTPNCSSFAPPYINNSYSYSNNSNSNINSSNNTTTTTSTHCLIGFTSTATSTISDGNNNNSNNTGGGGAIVIYKKRDWSIQHILVGHVGGVCSIAVHPTGKLALSGGINDGTIKLWDLTRGRLSYTTTIQCKQSFYSNSLDNNTDTNTTKQQQKKKKKEYDAIVCIVWDTTGTYYGYCYGNHITVQEVSSGQNVLDVEVPSKVNQICFIDGIDGIFIAAACNDGSLPVLAIEPVDANNDNNNSNNNNTNVRRAIMAIEPVEMDSTNHNSTIVAGIERFKCISSITGYYVCTANSAGVISVMNLQGAVNMILKPSTDDDDDDNDREFDSDPSDNDDDDEEEDNEQEYAVDIIDSVQVGSKSGGARITCLVAWTTNTNTNTNTTTPIISNDGNDPDVENIDTIESSTTGHKKQRTKKQSQDQYRNTKTTMNIVELDSEALSKARTLVSKAKKIQQQQMDKKKRTTQIDTIKKNHHHKNR